MFGITPRLDVDQVESQLFRNPSASLQRIKVWLQGYIAVTETKDREGDRAYRQQCMAFATRLSEKIPEFGKKTYSRLSDEEKGRIKDLYDVINQFLSVDDFPKKPRSKFGKFWQGILSALDATREAQAYESIRFLEDLEALLIAFKTHFFFHGSDQCSLQHEGKTVVLSSARLQQSRVFRPLMNRYLFPLMQIALQISPDRLAQLTTLHLTIPRKVQFSESASLFLPLFQLFEAVSKDLEPGNGSTSTASLFQTWKREGKELTDFFEGDFGYEADNLLLILQARFTETIVWRVSKLVGEYSTPLAEEAFFIDFFKLIREYPLGRKIKTEFILELEKLDVTDVLSLDGRLKDFVALMKAVAFTKEKLLRLFDAQEPLSSEQQSVVLHAVYVKVFEIFLSDKHDLFVDFICEERGILASCIQHVEHEKLALLFERLIPDLLRLQPNTDSCFRMTLCQRYEQANIEFPFPRASDELMMFTLKVSGNPAAVPQESPEGGGYASALFPAVLPVPTATAIDQKQFVKPPPLFATTAV